MQSWKYFMNLSKENTNEINIFRVISVSQAIDAGSSEGSVKFSDTYCILCQQLGGLLVRVENPEERQWDPHGFWVWTLRRFSPGKIVTIGTSALRVLVTANSVTESQYDNYPNWY